MRYLYVAEARIYSEQHHFGGKLEPTWRLFKESHYLHLEDPKDPVGHILISADFHSDWHQQAWHNHPGVGRLQHPTNEAGASLAQLHGPNFAHKQFTEAHCKAITSRLGIDCATATIHQIHKAAVLLNPQVRIDLSY